MHNITGCKERKQYKSSKIGLLIGNNGKYYKLQQLRIVILIILLQWTKPEIGMAVVANKQVKMERSLLNRSKWKGLSTFTNI